MTQLTKEEAIKKLNVIKEYLTAGNPIWDVREIDEVLDMAIDALQAEPVKHGEWQEHFDSIRATFEMRCSLCDYRLYIPQIDQFLQTSFCPNCGAKMDKE